MGGNRSSTRRIPSSLWDEELRKSSPKATESAIILASPLRPPKEHADFTDGILPQIYEQLNAPQLHIRPHQFDFRDLDCLFFPERRDTPRRLVDCDSVRYPDRADVANVIDAVCNHDAPVYAMIAPAFVGQFSSTVTPGKLRDAFKRMGFSGMIEVALFADILTLKEAFEFDRHILTERTSCSPAAAARCGSR